MGEKMELLEAVSRLDQGQPIFEHQVTPRCLAHLETLTIESEIVRCQIGRVFWFFAWVQKQNESQFDKAMQMLRAAREQTATKPRTPTK